jgi:hypothetical protein
VSVERILQNYCAIQFRNSKDNNNLKLVIVSDVLLCGVISVTLYLQQVQQIAQNNTGSFWEVFQFYTFLYGKHIKKKL